MTPASPRPAASVADVLSSLLSEPGRPRLTWYGPDGERIELSGAVLDNWVSKTTNLLVEELDAGPGTRVLLDLPPHWRTVLWALAAWRVGATVAVGEAAGADVVVTDRPADVDLPRGAGVVAVALPALARQFDGVLPGGALDAAQSVMTYGDVIGWVPAVEPARDALDLGTTPVPHAGLVASALEAAPVPAGSRTLVTVADERSAAPALLLTVLGLLAGGGSVVLLRPDAGDAPDRAERIASSERVTATL
ncbi:TIGR03089 family protein [Cellulomonas sp. Marseille-Q8402]